MRQTFYKYIIGLLILFTASAVSAPLQGKIPGRFVVKLKNSAKPDVLQKSLSGNVQLKKAFPAQYQRSVQHTDLISRYYILSSPDTTLSLASAKSLLGDDNIEYIEPDYFAHTFDYPNDSLFNNQWYLNNTGQPYIGVRRVEDFYNDYQILKTGTPTKDISVSDYYLDPPTEHTRVVVAIIDSGVDYLHPELAGQLWRNIDEIPDNNIDDDHNGYVDDTLGYDIAGDVFDFFNPIGDNEPLDTYGHGTHIAGIVAARRDASGVVGVAPNAVIMSIKIGANNNGGFTTSVGAEGIIYAVNNGAQVINLSWGTPFESAILRDALTFARSNNVFVAIAPGNFANADRYYPAGFDSTFVVAASNSDGYLTYFTSYGSHIDVASPGEDILSLRAAGTDLYGNLGEPDVHVVGADSLYYLADGTSMATPIAAGLAALLLSIAPDLTLHDLEQLIIDGAEDVLDPFNEGENLIGYDTLSGHGIISVDNSIALLTPEGISFSNPIKRQRYTTDLPIKVLPRGNYSGSWSLEYAIGENSNDWIFLASDIALPPDSVLTVLDDTFPDGLINLRLTDKNGNKVITDFFYIRHQVLELTSPQNGDEVKFDIEISGTAYGPEYDSLLIYYRHNGNQGIITSSTYEFYDSFIYSWKVSGIDTGQYVLYLFGYYETETIVDSAMFTINSVFAAGWPQTVGTRTALTPVITDLNKDNNKELIVPTGNGLFAFNADGTLLDNFPALGGNDVRCIPAIYDIDRDGEDEIIITDDSAIHVIKYDGSYADGWPQLCRTGMIAFGYGFPNPTVTRLGASEDSAIVIINTLGQILAYEFNGDSYFYSLQGYYTDFNSRLADFVSNGGRVSPSVTSSDLTGDGLYEVVAGYTSAAPFSGVGLFEGRTGEPYMDETDPVIIREGQVFGTALSDFNNDDLMEIITLGTDTLGIPTLQVTTSLNQMHGSFPISFPDISGWFISPLTMADLDLDGVAEIMFTAFWYDISHLFIFNSDGTPYKQLENAPYGVAFSDFVVFGTPVAANLTGDDYPEIVFRSGFLLPGTGPEQLYILDHAIEPVPGWPTATPTSFNQVLSTQFIPVIDDIDSDEKVELILISENTDILVWDFDASYKNGKNKIRFLGDNLNSNTYRPEGISTGIQDDIVGLPQSISLHQNYPNPFNPTTTISFELPQKTNVRLIVFNLLGQKVVTLTDEIKDAGMHTIEFDATEYASGLYLYRLETEESEVTRKMVLVK